MPPRLTDVERARLHELFAQLCRIASPFGREDEIAAAVRGELEAMGLDVEVDAFGNVFARVAGTGPTGVRTENRPPTSEGMGSTVRSAREDISRRKPCSGSVVETLRPW